MKLIWYSIVAITLFCETAIAQIYLIKLKGDITSSPFIPSPAVGDSISMEFTVESFDQDPEPLRGRYLGSGATLQLPNETWPAASSGALEVSVEPVNRVEYKGRTLSPLFLEPIFFDFNIRFNDLIVTADTIPTELPLESAGGRFFSVYPGLTDLFTGRITSYSAQIVPEPELCIPLAFYLFIVARRARF